MPSNNAKITRETRERILRTFLDGDYAQARVQARRHGLADNYPQKLARSRGLVPRTSKWWGPLKEHS